MWILDDVAQVYPRPRGGTTAKAATGANPTGLSPPTRGNLELRRGRGLLMGSIPAHAGEPKTAAVRVDRGGVYPRPRGGTPPAIQKKASTAGLSPPTRGNPTKGGTMLREVRSIPAHAGEPPSGGGSSRDPGVYPRPRGGTLVAPIRRCISEGLSPPTRGNRGEILEIQSTHGSIPAHAGEPEPPNRWRRFGGVYPRPRGGTDESRKKRSGDEGLSPPTRGNRSPRLCLYRLAGSIPAHAGEPLSYRRHAADHQVYPRPRGGTASSGGVE